MSTVISTTALTNAAAVLASAMPASVLPIGPQLEAWVLLLFGGALKGHGASVQATPPGTFRIRLNQHKTFKGPMSSWIEIEYNGRKYELHNSVQISGRSGAHHEVDVCLLAGSPTATPLSLHAFRAGIECKQHATAVSENVVRALLGVCLDISDAWPWPWPWPCPCYCFGVASTYQTTSANTTKLLDHYGIDFIGIDATLASHTHSKIDTFARRILPLL